MQQLSLFSHLHKSGVEVITNSPFRHPLPKLPGLAGDGRAFFLPGAARRADLLIGT
jgi:hypothetical protein